MRRLYLLIFVALCSCAPAYIPNVRNTPMFGEGKEFAANLAVASGAELQMAASLTDNVAVMANGATIFKKYSEPEFRRDHVFGEAAIGLYGRTKGSRYEVFAGYGMGQGNSFESFFFFGQTEVVAKGKYSRIFLQPSIGTNAKKVNIIFTSRFSMVKFSEFSTTADFVTTPVYKPTDSYHLFIEPAITTRFHLVGNIRGFFQLGLNAPVPNDVFYDYVTVQSAIGIQIHTGGLRTRAY